MSKLNRAFSHKEIAVILLLTLILLVMVYYRLVYVPIQREIASYDTTELDTSIQLEQARAAQIQQMKENIASGIEGYNGEVKTYDNQEGEINALHVILKRAETYQITARQPVATGNAVRRNVELRFTARSYSAVEQILNDIANCEYRCLIGNVSLSPNTTYTPYYVYDVNEVYRANTLTYDWINCSLNMTFFETLAGTDNRDGLLIEQ